MTRDESKVGFQDCTYKFPRRTSQPEPEDGDKAYLDAALLQSGGKQPKFKSYDKNKKSGGVMGMIEDVIHDAQQLEAGASSGEAAAEWIIFFEYLILKFIKLYYFNFKFQWRI